MVRSDDELETAKNALESRLEEAAVPIQNAFNAPKRDVVLAVLRNGEDPKEMQDDLRLALRQDLPFEKFVPIMASFNAAAWCEGRLDSI